MSKENVFEIFQGMINVQYAYWSKSSKAEVPLDDPGVIVYGKVDNKNPLFFHVRVQDLFIQSDKKYRIHDKATIHIDLFSIHHSMYHTLLVKEDFKNLADYVELLHSLELNLTEDKKVEFGEGAIINGYTLDNTVTGLIKDSSAPAYLTKVPVRNSENSKDLNAFEYDISFEFKPDDKLKEKLFVQSVLRQDVFAWVWVAHETSKNEYKTHFNIDVTNPKNRCEFLKAPDRNFFGAIDMLKAPLRKEKHYSRSDMYMQKFADGFPYDEQSMNYVEISQCLPFKSFSIGTQMGSVGICTMDTRYFDRHINHNRIHGSIFLVDNKPSIHCRLDTEEDKDFKPDSVADRGVVLHGLESKLNEFFSRADNRFFFREKSVSHWINSLEKDYPDSTYDNGLSTNYTDKKTFPFSDGKLEILSHDFVKDYKTDNKFLQ